MLRDWQVSGVTKLLSGHGGESDVPEHDTRGVAYSMPSYTNTVDVALQSDGPADQRGRARRPGPVEPGSPHGAVLQPGGVRDADAAERDRRRLRQRAARPAAQPDHQRVGRDARAPLPDQGHARQGVRVQVQAYNIFNQVEFLGMNTAIDVHRGEQCAEQQQRRQPEYECGRLEPSPDRTHDSVRLLDSGPGSAQGGARSDRPRASTRQTTVDRATPRRSYLNNSGANSPAPSARRARRARPRDRRTCA